MTVGKICSRVVATILPDETVGTAARRMAANAVGTLVVIEPNETTHAVGVVTDRDIAIRCIASKLDPEKTPVSKIMTAPAHTIDEEASIEHAASQMAGGATRRLVVTGVGRKLVGILSLDDVLDLLVEETGSIGRLLQRQRPHVAA